jgi:hypothetical protein
MPDNDIVPSGVRRLWHKPARMLLGDQPPSLVAAQVERTLAKELTDQQPPTALLLIKALRESVLFSDTAAAEQAFSQYRMEAGGQPPALEVHDSAAVFSELRRDELVGQPPEETARAVVEDALRRFAEARLCGPDMIAKRLQREGVSLDEIVARNDLCLDSVRYAPLVEGLLNENTRFRAPQQPKRSQADLLRVEIN